MEIRTITAADLPALLTLNNVEAERVNALTLGRLGAQVRCAFAARVTADGAAFLVAFDHSTPPQGPSHAWFIASERRFAYIDRVVVAPAARGKGRARALYDDLAASAKATQIDVLVCEVNLDPPNPESLAFHARLGFAAVGEGVDARTAKRVRYLRKPV